MPMPIPIPKHKTQDPRLKPRTTGLEGKRGRTKRHRVDDHCPVGRGVEHRGVQPGGRQSWSWSWSWGPWEMENDAGDRRRAPSQRWENAERERDSGETLEPGPLPAPYPRHQPLPRASECWQHGQYLHSTASTYAVRTRRPGAPADRGHWRVGREGSGWMIIPGAKQSPGISTSTGYREQETPADHNGARKISVDRRRPSLTLLPEQRHQRRS